MFSVTGIWVVDNDRNECIHIHSTSSVWIGKAQHGSMVWGVWGTGPLLLQNPAVAWLLIIPRQSVTVWYCASIMYSMKVLHLQARLPRQFLNTSDAYPAENIFLRNRNIWKRLSWWLRLAPIFLFSPTRIIHPEISFGASIVSCQGTFGAVSRRDSKYVHHKILVRRDFSNSNFLPFFH